MSNKPTFKPHGLGPPPRMQQVQIDLNRLESYHCPGCKCGAFTSVWQLREQPALLGGNPRPTLIRIESWMCIKCGAVWMVDQLKKLSWSQREGGSLVEELRHDASHGDSVSRYKKEESI